MPRWEGPPKFQYTPERLAAFREYNRAYRERLRHGRPPMTPRQVSQAGVAARLANQRKRAAAAQTKGASR